MPSNVRKQSGSMSPLVIAVIGIFVVIIAFFILNFNMLTGAHKQAQTAIDAAALQVAKDISEIVIEPADGSSFGYVALCDSLPKNNDYNNRPIVGINTLMATARLDALIADKLGNTTMQVLAVHDLERVKQDSRKLRDKILQAVSGGQAKDKNGKTIDLLANAQAIYDANAVRLGKGQRVGALSISIGRLKDGSGLTNIPVPVPQSMAQLNPSIMTSSSSGSFYKAYTAIDTNVGSNKLTYIFTAVADSVRLMPNSDFTLFAKGGVDDYLAPSVVQVSANELVQKLDSKNVSRDNNENQQIRVSATAVAGGALQQAPSGSLQVSFPGGKPPGGSIDSSSVKAIMNNSQITVAQLPQDGQAVTVNASTIGSSSPYNGWNSVSKGSWMAAKGGAVPASPSGTLESANFRGRQSDDPSVVLSFLVYDWLHQMYLRPNIESVNNALSAQLWNQNGQAISMNSNSLIPQAFAADDKHLPVTFGIFNVSTDGSNDPRDLRKFKESPDAYRRQFANVFGYVSADMTLPSTSLVVSMDENSRVVTTNGQPAEILYDLWRSITNANLSASDTLQNAQLALEKKIEEVNALEADLKLIDEKITGKGSGGKFANMGGGELQALAQQLNSQKTVALAKAKRAYNALVNSSYAINLSLGMLNDRKTISAFGVTKVSYRAYDVAGGRYYPSTQAATMDQILGEGLVSTGQDPLAGNTDWCYALNADGGSQLNFFERVNKISTGKLHNTDGLLQPALAATTIPQSNQNIFIFSVSGSAATSNSEGTVSRTNPNVSLSGPNLLEGQLLYQNTASLVTTSPGSSLKEVWNCIARDNGSDYGAKGYFANSKDPGSNAPPGSNSFPALIAEWSLRCPAPVGGGPTTSCEKKPVVAVHAVDNVIDGAYRQGQFDNVGAVNTAIEYVTPKTDAAGNVSYFYKDMEIHFLEGDEWLAAVKKTSDMIGKNMPASELISDLQGAGIQRSTLSREAGDPKFLAGYNNTQLTNWAKNHQLITNTDQLGSYGYKGATTLGDMRYSVYSQLVFYTLDTNLCPQLYRWSS